MKIIKAINFAYPSSISAKKLGFDVDGCWHVDLTAINEDGSCVTFLPHDAEGFANPCDPDLISLFKDCEGEVSGCFKKYGNKESLKALGLWEG